MEMLNDQTIRSLIILAIVFTAVAYSEYVDNKGKKK